MQQTNETCRAEIQEIFDEKITDLTQLLDDQVRNLQLTHPAQKIVCSPYREVYSISN
jgi:hypothetical protein